MTKTEEFMATDLCMKAACAVESSDCFVGQWTVHQPHHHEIEGMGVNRHRGKYQVHCPGKTEATRLR